jgi:DNA-binding PadR family transcriptional regulator
MSLKHALLTLLADEKLSGYDLVQYFDGSVGFVWHATHPQIYRELEKLRRERLISGTLVVQRARPNKTVYGLTRKGRRELLAWVTTPAPRRTIKDGTLLRAFSYGRIPPALAQQRLRDYRAQHEQQLAHYRVLAELVAGVAHDRRRLGALLTLRAGLFVEEAYLRWCDWALEHLRQPAVPGVKELAGRGTRAATRAAGARRARR